MMSTEKDIAERLRDAYTRTGGNAVGDPFVSQIAREIAAVASAIEARRAETGTGSVHESAVRAAGTPIPSLVGEVVEAARAYLISTRASADTRPKRELKAALSALDAAPRIRVEEVAREIMVADDCGLTVKGERVLCDHPLALGRNKDCGCRKAARAVLSLLASGVPADDTPPSLPNASQYYATDKSGQWHYVNHAGTWQACPPPFSSPAERAIRNEALEEAKQVTTERYHPALDSLKTKDA